MAEENPKEHFKKFFEEHKLSAQALTIALIAHESLGFLWLGGTWYSCYKLQPTKLVATLASADKISNFTDRAKRYFNSMKTN